MFARVSKEDTIVGGWELDKELQSSKKIKKKKEMWRRFEDKLWLLLNAFEFEELNKDYEPEVILSTKQQTKKDLT